MCDPLYLLFCNFSNVAFSRNSPINRYFWLGAVNFGFAFLFIESRRARAAERALYQSKNDRAHSTLQQIFLQLEKQLRKLNIFIDDVTYTKSKSKKNVVNNQSQNNLTEKIMHVQLSLGSPRSESFTPGELNYSLLFIGYKL